MGKRKKLALKKGAIPSIFNVSINGNAVCDLSEPLECNTSSEPFRKELFANPLKCSTPIINPIRSQLFDKPTCKRLCTTLSTEVHLLLFFI